MGLGQVGVTGRHPKILVPKDHPHGPQVRPPHHKLTGEIMSKIMKPEVGNPCPLGGPASPDGGLGSASRGMGEPRSASSTSNGIEPLMSLPGQDCIEISAGFLIVGLDS